MGDQSIEEKLLLYEDLFRHRYTDQDEDYITTLNTPLADPPCVENWYSKPKRAYDRNRPDYSRGGYNQHRGARGHHSDYRQRDRYHPYSDRHGQNYHHHHDHRQGQDRHFYEGRRDQQRYNSYSDRPGQRPYNQNRGGHWT